MRDTRKPTGPIMVPSHAMVRVYELVSEVAGTDVSVLVLGETGVGKEVISRTIQQRSTRAEAPFVCLNCAALPEALLESELFGYERGAFSGAVNPKPGLIESADGGTLFLDEIGELPLSTQTKLLRVLETREVPRLGSLKAKHVDFRLITATNKNLRQEIAAGRFRADLYYRINGLSITIPPLRERKNELPYLAALFAARAARQLKKNEPFFDREALIALEAYDWPGNVRELKNVVERAVLLCRAGTVLTEHLPADVLGASEFEVDDLPTLTTRTVVIDPEVPSPVSSRTSAPPPPLPPEPPSAPARVQSLKEETDRLEYERIVATLQRFQGNQSRAAEALGMTRRALIVRLDRFRIPRPRKLET
jgi:transcriptional regulator with GAF, ATPase, and Fis domain